MLDARTLSTGEVLDADFCVVGSGAGGAVAAWELARTGHRVVVVEDGGLFSSDDFTDNGVEMIGKLYRDAGMVATTSLPFIQIPHARCVGGTTVVNCGSSFRLPASYYESHPGFPDEAALTPHFDEIERRLEIAPTPREHAARQNLLLEAGANALGHSGAFIPRNAPGCRGAGFCNNGCPKGAKLSMERAFVPWAVDHGATVLYNLRAVRLEPRPKGVTVHCRVSEAKRPAIQIEARHVLVAAGTLHTPGLLRASRLPGLSPHAGRNLTIHPTSGLTGEFEEPVEMWDGVPQAYCVDAFADDGVLLEGIGVSADLAALSLPHHGAAHADFMGRLRHMASIGLMVSDEPNGSVRKAFGLLWIRYRLTEAVVARMKTALIEGGRIMLAAGASKVHFAVQNLEPVDSVAALERLDLSGLKPSDVHWTAFHPLGTCRIGDAAADGVVDARGRVHGQDRIHVCDGSVLPASTQVNPQLAIMAVARHVASELTA